MDSLRLGRRGFTLMEMVVAVAVVGIVAAIAVPNIFRLSQRNALRSTANTLVSALKLARSSAATGRMAVVPAPGTTARTVEAGVRFNTDTQYDVFLDQDRVANSGNEAIVRSYDLTDDYPSFRLIGPPAEIRYRQNGMLTAPPDVTVLLRDLDTGLEYSVQATFGGRVEIQY